MSDAIPSEAERIKHRATRKFLRSGGNGDHTKLFGDLAPDRQAALLNELQPERSETPIIGKYLNPGNWFVLTTERLVSCAGERREEVPTRSIAGPAYRISTPAQKRSDFAGPTLRFVTRSGVENVIVVEERRPWSGMYGALLAIGAWNSGTERRRIRESNSPNVESRTEKR